MSGYGLRNKRGGHNNPPPIGKRNTPTNKNTVTSDSHKNAPNNRNKERPDVSIPRRETLEVRPTDLRISRRTDNSNDKEPSNPPVEVEEVNQRDGNDGNVAQTPN